MSFLLIVDGLFAGVCRRQLVPKLSDIRTATGIVHTLQTDVRGDVLTPAQGPSTVSSAGSGWPWSRWFAAVWTIAVMHGAVHRIV